MRHRTAQQRNATSLKRQLQEFFFADEVPYGLAIVRILLPLVLFVDLLKRWSFARELFSADGATAPLWITYGFPSPLPELPGAVAVALFTLLLATLLASSLGWMTRASLAIATTLYLYFTLLDAIGTITKYTVIATHLMLLLSVSRCGAVWSLDALRRPVAGPRFPAWPRRLMQILIGVIYLGAAVTKFHTPAYFNGDQMLWWTLTHVNGSHPLGETFAYYPGLLAVGAYAAILFEVLFLFLCWRGWGRVVMLVTGVGFHIATWLTLGIDIFPCVMITSYFCFTNERDVYRWSRGLNRLAARIGLPLRELAERATRLLAQTRRLGPLAFAMALWGIALAGVAAERLNDPYAERGAAGPLPLRELDDDQVRTMLAGTSPLRPEDRIFGFELGTHLFGDALIGRKNVFKSGEELIAQCIASPPHGDVYVECNLYTADGRIVERQGLILLREASRLNFRYMICDAVPPGDYELVLQLANTEVTRRKFTVAGEQGFPAGPVAPTAMAGKLAE